LIHFYKRAIKVCTMSFNRYMHPDNKYKVAPDFKQLALKYPEFLKHLTQDVRGRLQLDFKNPESLRILSQTLLLEDFNLRVAIPPGSLVPTIPSRLNYLLWIKDLINLVDQSAAPETIRGIDIGTGSSSVYCLLGAKQFGWSMLGTEVDSRNHEHALSNITENHLEARISLVKVSENQILDLAELKEKSYTFTMCNPPFFTRESPGEPPGKDCEVKTAGGEVSFVSRMADQSKLVQQQVKIFSTLLGHKSSLLPVKHYLQDLGVTTVTTTEFCQGRCMRWGVAWSFQSLPDLKGLRSTKTKKDMEKPFVWSLPCESGSSLNLFQTLKLWFTPIKVDIAIKKETKNFCSARLTSYQTLWRNQRKQRRERHRKEDKKETDKKIEVGGKYSESMEADEYFDNGSESCLLSELLHKDSTSCLNSTELERVDSTSCLNSTELERVDSTSCLNSTEQEIEDKTNSTESDRFKENLRLENSSVNGSNGAHNPHDVENIDLSLQEEETLKLECNITIRLCGPVVRVELVYLDGEAGRDGVHQLIQYCKNKNSTR